MSVIFLKIISTSFRLVAVEGDATPLGTASLWVASVGLACCAPTQLYILNMALGNGRATLAMPVYLSLIVLLLSLCGGLIFAEFDGLAALNLGLLSLGVAITIVGIVGLTVAQGRRARGEAPAPPPTSKVEPAPARKGFCAGVRGEPELAVVESTIGGSSRHMVGTCS